MEASHLIFGFRWLGLSTFRPSQNLRSKGKFAVRFAAIALVAVLFLPVLAFAQGDTLILLGICTEADENYAVSVYNKNAFVTEGGWGLKVINYSDPEDPSLVTTYPGRAWDIEIKDSLAYCAGECFTIQDISNPLEPDTIGQCCCYANSQKRVHVFDTLALTLLSTPLGDLRLLIIDVADPANPHLLSWTWPTPGNVLGGDIYKKDNYVYWVDRVYYPEEAGRIIVFDITDPTDPVEIVTDTCLPSAPHAIWIKDNYAYVAVGNLGPVRHGGLMVLDISDPYDIDSLGFFEIPDRVAYNVYIKCNFAYVSAHRKAGVEGDGVYVVDITDPTSPSLVTYYDTPGIPRDIFVDEPYVLAADYTSLLVFQASFLDLIAGDVNGDGEVDLGDVVFLISHLYREGPPPDPVGRGDVNGDCVVDLGDVVYLISYLYRDGPAPQE